AVHATNLEEKLAELDQPPTLRELAVLDESLDPLIEAALENVPPEPAPSGQDPRTPLADLAQGVREAGEHARERLLALESLARRIDEMAAMDFTFLFDP